MKKNFLKSKIIKITLAILITFIVVAIVFNIVKRRTSEHIVEDYLLDKYNVEEYKYIKKEHLVEEKDHVLKKIEYSYLYYYEFTYRGITTYVYFRDDTDDCFDDYQYEDELNYVYQEFEEYTAYNGAKIADYLDPKELFYGGPRKLIIGFQEDANELLNQDVLSKCYEIMDKLKTDFNDQDVQLLLAFHDYMILLDDNSTFQINHSNPNYEFEKNLEKYDSSNLDEEQLKECVKGKLSSCKGE